MSEGRTSAAQAGVDGEDRPVDTSASTGAAGAGDVAGTAETEGTEGHAGTEGHDGTAGSPAEESATVPAATLPGEGSESAPAHGAAATSSATTSSATTSDATGTDAATTEGSTTDAATSDTADGTTDGTTSATAAQRSAGADEGGTGAAEADADRPGTSQPGSSQSGASGNGDEEWADAEDKAYKRELRKGFAFGAAGGIVIGAIVALLLGAFVWPGYLLGPGSPDDTANQVTTALSAKDGPTLDRLSCKGPDGKPVSQLSGQVLQYIAKVAPAGPTSTLIDTEARTPVDVTLSVQGQTQTLPSELVLGESQGNWCLKGLAQRQ